MCCLPPTYFRCLRSLHAHVDVRRSKIERHIPGRTAPRCRERWTGSLAPTLNRLPWGQKEIQDLGTLVTSMGKPLHCVHFQSGSGSGMMCWGTGVDVAAAGSRKWSELAVALGTGRTDAQCRKQWQTLQNQRQRAEAAAEAAAAGRAIMPAGATQANAGACGETIGTRGSVSDDVESVGLQPHPPSWTAASIGDETGP